MTLATPRTALGRGLRDVRIPRKMAVVITAHVAHAVILVVLLSLGLRAVDASRGYVEAESLWSKAEKDAVLHLAAFARSGNPADLQAYRAAINVTLGSQQARRELDQASPDMARVRAGFLQGGTRAVDVADMAWLLRTFRNDDHVGRALAAWSRADDRMAALHGLGDQLVAEVTAPHPDAGRISALQDGVAARNAELAGQETDLAAVIGEGAHAAKEIALWGTFAAAALFVGLALALSTMVARQLAEAARQAETAAIRMSAGDLQARMAVQGNDEFGVVALAFNEMAVRLRDISHDARVQGDALRQGMDEFRLLAAHVPIGIFRIDARGSIEYANPKWGELAGCDYHDFLAVRQAVHPEDQPRLQAGWRKAFAEGSEFADTIRYVHRDGKVVECTTRATPLRRPDGSLAGYVGLLEDVAEHRREEAERARAERQRREVQTLKALNDFRMQFINTAAHELRTPLLAMRLQIHLFGLREEPRTPDEVRGLVILERNAVRLATLVEDFLQAAEIQAGLLRLKPRSTDVKGVVQEAVAALGEQVAARGIEVDIVALGDLTAPCDGARLRRATENLLDNALKFSSRGGRVRIELVGSATTVEMRITDDGIGLRPEDLAKLFTPFSQVHDTREVTEPGSGLGLYIAKAIIALHHGSVGAESPGPGRGATFWFRIPKSGGYLPAPREAGPP